MRLSLALVFAAVASAMITPSSVSHDALEARHEKNSHELAQVAPTRFASVNGTRIAYLRFGKKSQVPLFFMTHFRGSMDVLDPLLVNTIAQNREVIIFDNSGIGHSGGEVPDSIQAMAATAAGFLSAIRVPKVDLVGFSMGGMVAQIFAMEYPETVNKLVLSGVRPGYGEGVVQTDPDAAAGPGGAPDAQPTEDYMLGIFFFPSNTSLAKGNLWWDRLAERKVKEEERKDFLVGAGVGAQLTAINSFASDPQLYARLANITSQVLVTNGKDDVLMGTPNSFVLQQRLPDAQLHLYPDSGHGHLFQFPLAFAKQLELFLRC